ncbi:hypothetical protein H696_02248 [Fonticula alba]|uniref:Inositol polyphosphate-related phosphatase domain-containing protein n=1 Tax=Fonticula alba TaxID=691883 RepID=A0A058ZCY8_FONAL|nr:hypothetical protein H696_02248 [Fonticula alba]KCV71302.1 hypothetical protein H696_02248 [Fonticula alba]|eukprot:XP_009494425.1 hypothetical protein H696_02248 [Fonticula alba]
MCPPEASSSAAPDANRASFHALRQRWLDMDGTSDSGNFGDGGGGGSGNGGTGSDGGGSGGGGGGGGGGTTTPGAVGGIPRSQVPSPIGARPRLPSVIGGPIITSSTVTIQIDLPIAPAVSASPVVPTIVVDPPCRASVTLLSTADADKGDEQATPDPSDDEAASETTPSPRPVSPMMATAAAATATATATAAASSMPIPRCDVGGSASASHLPSLLQPDSPGPRLEPSFGSLSDLTAGSQAGSLSTSQALRRRLSRVISMQYGSSGSLAASSSDLSAPSGRGPSSTTHLPPEILLGGDHLGGSLAGTMATSPVGDMAGTPSPVTSDTPLGPPRPGLVLPLGMAPSPSAPLSAGSPSPAGRRSFMALSPSASRSTDSLHSTGTGGAATSSEEVAQLLRQLTEADAAATGQADDPAGALPARPPPSHYSRLMSQSETPQRGRLRSGTFGLQPVITATLAGPAASGSPGITAVSTPGPDGSPAMSALPASPRAMMSTPPPASIGSPHAAGAAYRPLHVASSPGLMAMGTASPASPPSVLLLSPPALALDGVEDPADGASDTPSTPTTASMAATTAASSGGSIESGPSLADLAAGAGGSFERYVQLRRAAEQQNALAPAAEPFASASSASLADSTSRQGPEGGPALPAGAPVPRPRLLDTVMAMQDELAILGPEAWYMMEEGVSPDMLDHLGDLSNPLLGMENLRASAIGIAPPAGGPPGQLPLPRQSHAGSPSSETLAGLARISRSLRRPSLPGTSGGAFLPIGARAQLGTSIAGAPSAVGKDLELPVPLASVPASAQHQHAHHVQHPRKEAPAAIATTGVAAAAAAAATANVAAAGAATVAPPAGIIPDYARCNYQPPLYPSSVYVKKFRARTSVRSFIVGDGVVLTGSSGIRSWSMKSGECLKTGCFELETSKVNSLIFCPFDIKGTIVWAGCSDGSLLVFNIATGVLLATWRRPGSGAGDAQVDGHAPAPSDAHTSIAPTAAFLSTPDAVRPVLPTAEPGSGGPAGPQQPSPIPGGPDAAGGVELSTDSTSIELVALFFDPGTPLGVSSDTGQYIPPRVVALSADGAVTIFNSKPATPVSHASLLGGFFDQFTVEYVHLGVTRATQSVFIPPQLIGEVPVRAAGGQEANVSVYEPSALWLAKRHRAWVFSNFNSRRCQSLDTDGVFHAAARAAVAAAAESAAAEDSLLGGDEVPAEALGPGRHHRSMSVASAMRTGSGGPVSDSGAESASNVPSGGAAKRAALEASSSGASTITGVAALMNGEYVCTGHQDGRILIWRKRPYGLSAVTSPGAGAGAGGSSARPGSVHGALVASGSHVFDLFNFITMGEPVTSLSAITDSPLLWVGFGSGKIAILDASDNWNCAKEWKAHKSPVLQIVLPQSSLLSTAASLAENGRIRFWDSLLRADSILLSLKAQEALYCQYTDAHVGVFSWNVSGTSPFSIGPVNLARMFFPGCDAFRRGGPSGRFRRAAGSAPPASAPGDVPDLLVIGLQEVVELDLNRKNAKQFLKDVRSEQALSNWHHTISGALRYAHPNRYFTCVDSKAMIGLMIFVFAADKIGPLVRSVAVDSTKTGLGGKAGNKGSVGVRLRVLDSSFCFLNCHLAAGQTRSKDRDSDAAAILKSTQFPSARREADRVAFINGGDGSRALDHEFCFFFGDLNYRVDMTPAEAWQALQRGGSLNALAAMLNRDQFRAHQPRNALRVFNEARIRFPPTYKLVKGTHSYDIGSERTPSWCDRILSRGLGIQQTHGRARLGPFPGRRASPDAANLAAKEGQAQSSGTYAGLL